MITDFIKASASQNFNNTTIHELNPIYSEETHYNNMATSNSLSYEIVEILTPVKNDKKNKGGKYFTLAQK